MNYTFECDSSSSLIHTEHVCYMDVLYVSSSLMFSKSATGQWKLSHLLVCDR